MRVGRNNIGPKEGRSPTSGALMSTEGDGVAVRPSGENDVKGIGVSSSDDGAPTEGDGVAVSPNGENDWKGSEVGKLSTCNLLLRACWSCAEQTSEWKRP